MILFSTMSQLDNALQSIANTLQCFAFLSIVFGGCRWVREFAPQSKTDPDSLWMGPHPACWPVGNQWMSCKVTKVQRPLHSWVLTQAEYFNKNTATIILQQEYSNQNTARRILQHGWAKWWQPTAVHCWSFAKLTFPGASRSEPPTPCHTQKMSLLLRKLRKNRLSLRKKAHW